MVEVFFDIFWKGLLHVSQNKQNSYIMIDILNHMKICDAIKQNESELANIDFKIQSNEADSFFCFLLFLQSLNRLYLQNQVPNLCGVFTKLKPK